MATLNEARAAKERAKEVLANVGEIRGIGIARTEHGFGVKVNLAHESEQHLPQDLDGVPLVVEIVGEIRPFEEAAQPGVGDENNEAGDAPTTPTWDLGPSNVPAEDLSYTEKHADE